MAQKNAWRSAKETGSLMPPSHILNAPTRLMKDIGYGKGYAYDHDADEGFSGQDYWPEEMDPQTFYEPSRPRLRSQDPRAASLIGTSCEQIANNGRKNGDLENVPDRSAGGLLARPADPVGTARGLRDPHPHRHPFHRQGGPVGGGQDDRPHAGPQAPPAGGRAIRSAPSSAVSPIGWCGWSGWSRRFSRSACREC